MLLFLYNSNENYDQWRLLACAGHMDCYFRLASQFRTQDEPAYCGLSTLIMVLNAMEIDPGRVWKGQSGSKLSPLQTVNGTRD